MRRIAAFIVVMIVLIGILGGYIFWPHTLHSPVSSGTMATTSVAATLPIMNTPTTTISTLSVASTSGPSTFAPATSTAMKLYRNNQYGFEFRYPAAWTLHPDSFTNPNSIFNLIANPEGDYMGFGVNVTTIDFGKRVDAMDNPVGKIAIDGNVYTKYAYQFEGETEETVHVPRGNFYILIIGHPAHIPNLDQIFKSFKFFSTSTAATPK